MFLSDINVCLSLSLPKNQWTYPQVRMLKKKKKEEVVSSIHTLLSITEMYAHQKQQLKDENSCF